MNVSVGKEWRKGRTKKFPWVYAGYFAVITVDVNDSECKDDALALNLSSAIGQVLQYVLPGVAGFVIGKIAEKLQQYADGIAGANGGWGVIARIGIPFPGLSFGLDSFSVDSKLPPSVSTGSNPSPKEPVGKPGDYVPSGWNSP